MIKKIELYEIPLEKELGYFYAKVLYIENKEPSVGEVMVRVYDSYHKQSRYQKNKVLDKTLFENENYYTYPFLLMKKPNIRGKYKWYLMGELEVDGHNEKIPDFAALNLKQEMGKVDSNTPTSIIRKVGLEMFTCPHKNAKHLGRYYHCVSNYVKRYITLLWLIEKDFKGELEQHPRENFSPALREKVIKDNFTFEEYNELAFRITFNDIKRRRSYKTIPKEIRDKVIES